MLNVGGPSQWELKILENQILRIFAFCAKKIQKSEKKIWQIWTKMDGISKRLHLGLWKIVLKILEDPG